MAYDSKFKRDDIDELFDGVLTLKDREDCYRFFEDICTINGPNFLAPGTGFICISYHGVSRANVKEGDKVLVVGAGTIGVLAAIAAKAKGASVYISDVSAGKLEMAKDFGVDGTLLNDSPENFEKRVNEITDGNGFDVTIEAVGLPSPVFLHPFWHSAL